MASCQVGLCNLWTTTAVMKTTTLPITATNKTARIPTIKSLNLRCSAVRCYLSNIDPFRKHGKRLRRRPAPREHASTRRSESISANRVYRRTGAAVFPACRGTSACPRVSSGQLSPNSPDLTYSQRRARLTAIKRDFSSAPATGPRWRLPCWTS